MSRGSAIARTPWWPFASALAALFFLSCATTIPKTLANQDGQLRYRVGVAAVRDRDLVMAALETELASRGRPVAVAPWDAGPGARSAREAREGWWDLVLVASPAMEAGPEGLALAAYEASGSPGDMARSMAEEIERRLFSGRAPETSTVFRNGEGGYAVFRIPSLLQAGDRLLAFSEGRAGTKTDSERNDLVSRSSDDGGRTWSPVQVVAAAGGASYNNPTSVWLPDRGRVLLVFQRYPPNRGEASTTRGIEGENICRVLLTYSDDLGRTWASPRDITRETKLPTMSAVASGPGRAILVTEGPDKGRILVPFNSSGTVAGWYDYLVASDDGGETWKVLPGRSWYGANESQLVQVGPTEFLVNSRDHRWKGGGATKPIFWFPWLPGLTNRSRSAIRVAISGNEAVWGPTEPQAALPDPLCQGSILRWSGLGDREGSILLFSNAANSLALSGSGPSISAGLQRMNGVVRASYDEGRTWPVARRIWGDRYSAFQYSALERLPDSRVGCLFERWPEIVFTSFGLEWLEAAGGTR